MSRTQRVIGAWVRVAKLIGRDWQEVATSSLHFAYELSWYCRYAVPQYYYLITVPNPVQVASYATVTVCT